MQASSLPRLPSPRLEPRDSPPRLDSSAPWRFARKFLQLPPVADEPSPRRAPFRRERAPLALIQANASARRQPRAGSQLWDVRLRKSARAIRHPSIALGYPCRDRRLVRTSAAAHKSGIEAAAAGIAAPDSGGDHTTAAAPRSPALDNTPVAHRALAVPQPLFASLNPPRSDPSRAKAVGVGTARRTAPAVAATPVTRTPAAIAPGPTASTHFPKPPPEVWSKPPVFPASHPPRRRRAPTTCPASTSPP